MSQLDEELPCACIVALVPAITAGGAARGGPAVATRPRRPPPPAAGLQLAGRLYRRSMPARFWARDLHLFRRDAAARRGLSSAAARSAIIGNGRRPSCSASRPISAIAARSTPRPSPGTIAEPDRHAAFSARSAGRVGYAFTPRWLAYATARLRLWDRISRRAASPRSFRRRSAGDATGTTVRAGWTAGAGVEYAWSDKISVKGEYLYTELADLGRQLFHQFRRRADQCEERRPYRARRPQLSLHDAGRSRSRAHRDQVKSSPTRPRPFRPRARQ